MDYFRPLMRTWCNPLLKASAYSCIEETMWRKYSYGKTLHIFNVQCYYFYYCKNERYLPTILFIELFFIIYKGSTAIIIYNIIIYCIIMYSIIIYSIIISVILLACYLCICNFKQLLFLVVNIDYEFANASMHRK